MAVKQGRTWGAYVDPPLRGRVAVVTGAAKGLGGAITDLLACDGAHIVLAGRDLEALEAHAARLGAEYPESEALVKSCDVTDEADVQALIGAAVGRFGGLDILINTAGVTGPIETPAQDVSVDDFRAVLDVNLVGTFLPCKSAIPHLIERGGGRIVNVAGTSGLRGYRNRVSYSSSKWAVRGLTRTLALELGPHNITVECHLPERHPRRANDEDRERESPSPRPATGRRLRRLRRADRARALHRGLRRRVRRPLPRLGRGKKRDRARHRRRRGLGRVIPRPFDYERPRTVEEAVSFLADAGGDARLIAGGQSLVPMLSLGLARPDLLIDLARLELDGIATVDGRVRVGALTRHRTLELDPEARALLPLAAEAAAHVGNPRVRNRGTFGGSLAHADPAAELPVVAVAYGGEIVAHGPGGERRIPLEQFFLGYLETALAPDEVLVAAELERPQEGSGVGFHEEAQRADDFALACAAAVVMPDGRGAWSSAGSATGRCATRDARRSFPAAVEAGVEPEEDAFVSAAFRRRLAGVCARRAVERAQAGAPA